MRNALRRPPGQPPNDEPARTSFVCACCGRTVVTAVEGSFCNPNVGSVRRFCDAACRQAAWRRRQAGVPEATAPQPRGGRARGLAKGGEPEG